VVGSTDIAILNGHFFIRRPFHEAATCKKPRTIFLVGPRFVGRRLQRPCSQSQIATPPTPPLLTSGFSTARPVFHLPQILTFRYQISSVYSLFNVGSNVQIVDLKTTLKVELICEI
jgi:hypothetical protein